MSFTKASFANDCISLLNGIKIPKKTNQITLLFDGEGRFAETGAVHWQSAIFGVGFDEFVYDITFEEQVVSVVEQYLELRERTTLSTYVEGLPSGAYGRASERMR
ncbi:hypothetical protein E4U24_006414 [Claviceps purpurea]|nr:hypothetical protein E4U24_006414 [Claviceps purpurea]